MLCENMVWIVKVLLPERLVRLSFRRDSGDDSDNILLAVRRLWLVSRHISFSFLKYGR
jgi:hypothetical protein